MANLSDFIKLTAEQYNTLKTNGSITVGGVTYNYDPNAVYLVDGVNNIANIDQQQSFTSSTSYSYTGVSFTIPANCYFMVTVSCGYNNGIPYEVGISTSSSSSTNTIAHQVRSSDHADVFLTCTLNWTTDSNPTTYYIWAKYENATSNSILIKGFYMLRTDSFSANAGPYLPLTGGTLSGDVLGPGYFSPNGTNGAGIIPWGQNEIDFYTSAGTDLWFNYSKPQNGNTVGTFRFGNGTSGGYGNIVANAIYLPEKVQVNTIEGYTNTSPKIQFDGNDINIHNADFTIRENKGLYLYNSSNVERASIVDGTLKCEVIRGIGSFNSSNYVFYYTNMAPNWNNQLDIGASGLSWHYIYANGGSWTSDRRLKENIKDTELEALPLINQLSIRDYNWKDGQKEESIGIIAQELRDIVPEKYEDIFIRGEETEDKYLSIDSGSLVMLALKAIQEQQSKIKELEDRIKELEK